MAALYPVLNPWAPSDDFYLSLVMGAGAVLDVGCGTGALLHSAREAGHTGRLCGVDPDPAMLAIARTRGDIEWHEATAASLSDEGAFDLAVMTGHAFQCLVDDDEVRDSLAAIRRALVPGGCFAFETRNPHARAWEEWATADAIEVIDPGGRHVCVSYHIDSVVDDVVTLVETTSASDGAILRADRASLRFLSVAALSRYLGEAGFTVETQYGAWNRTPLTDTSAEIITIASI